MIQGVAVLIFPYNFIPSYSRGEIAGDDPWDAWTLEWTTSSPHLFTTLKNFPKCIAADLCGISSIRMIRIGSMKHE
jgi:heme/copper-type cytochrome/quinol oxidase subunit 1